MNDDRPWKYLPDRTRRRPDLHQRRRPAMEGTAAGSYRGKWNSDIRRGIHSPRQRLVREERAGPNRGGQPPSGRRAKLGSRIDGGQRSLVSGHGGSERRLSYREGSRRSLSQKSKPPSDDGRRSLHDRTNNGRRVTNLKFVKVRAVVDDGRMAVGRSESQDGTKRTC